MQAKYFCLLVLDFGESTLVRNKYHGNNAAVIVEKVGEYDVTLLPANQVSNLGSC